MADYCKNMKNRTILLVFILFGGALHAQNDVKFSDLSANDQVAAIEALKNGNCAYKGFQFSGRVKIVEHFPDIRVKYVKHFADIRVKFVEHFPNDCGEWQIVDHFPNLKVKIVDHFEDIKIKKVNHFPGPD